MSNKKFYVVRNNIGVDTRVYHPLTPHEQPKKVVFDRDGVPFTREAQSRTQFYDYWARLTKNENGVIFGAVYKAHKNKTQVKVCIEPFPIPLAMIQGYTIPEIKEALLRMVVK